MPTMNWLHRNPCPRCSNVHLSHVEAGTSPPSHWLRCNACGVEGPASRARDGAQGAMRRWRTWRDREIAVVHARDPELDARERARGELTDGMHRVLEQMADGEKPDRRLVGRTRGGGYGAAWADLVAKGFVTGTPARGTLTDKARLLVGDREKRAHHSPVQ